jgi:hypothetical protein
VWVGRWAWVSSFEVVVVLRCEVANCEVHCGQR